MDSDPGRTNERVGAASFVLELRLRDNGRRRREVENVVEQFDSDGDGDIDNDDDDEPTTTRARPSPSPRVRGREREPGPGSDTNDSAGTGAIERCRALQASAGTGGSRHRQSGVSVSVLESDGSAATRTRISTRVALVTHSDPVRRVPGSRWLDALSLALSSLVLHSGSESESLDLGACPPTPDRYRVPSPDGRQPTNDSRQTTSEGTRSVQRSAFSVAEQATRQASVEITQHRQTTDWGSGLGRGGAGSIHGTRGGGQCGGGIEYDEYGRA